MFAPTQLAKVQYAGPKVQYAGTGIVGIQPIASLANYVDPDAGSLLDDGDDTSPICEVDPDAGSLIII